MIKVKIIHDKHPLVICTIYGAISGHKLIKLSVLISLNYSVKWLSS